MCNIKQISSVEKNKCKKTVLKKIQSQQRQRVALMTQQTLYGYMGNFVQECKHTYTNNILQDEMIQMY